MMLRKILALIAVSFFLSGQAVAASSCYTLPEAEAEQGIRIHSELMVIGLNCQHMYRANGKNLYSEYRNITSDNVKLFASYEERLMEYFKRTGAPDPEGQLNSLRTVFANKIANDSARMRPDQFCKHYAGRIQQVSGMSQADIKKWAGTFYPSHPVSKPLCNN
ncbi:MAG: hypothetical protein ACK4NR_07300 [Micavibrio sp.]